RYRIADRGRGAGRGGLGPGGPPHRAVTRTPLRYGRPAPGGRRIRTMSGDLDQARFAQPGFAEYLTPRTTWVIVAAFAAVTAVAALPVKPNAPAAAVAGMVTVGAAG